MYNVQYGVTTEGLWLRCYSDGMLMNETLYRFTDLGACDDDNKRVTALAIVVGVLLVVCLAVIIGTFRKR